MAEVRLRSAARNCCGKLKNGKSFFSGTPLATISASRGSPSKSELRILIDIIVWGQSIVPNGLCRGQAVLCCACHMQGDPTIAAPAAGKRVFAARGLRKVYHTGEVDVVALDGVEVELHEGEFVVLLGPSGSGKSTLLNILGGLDVPSAGNLSYKGWALDGAGESTLTLFRRNCVGFVFQFYNLIPSLTARENVALITGIARNPMPPEEALAMVGLQSRMDHFPSQLSGGEQQRVAIARAIAKRPEVLLCDEPTGALDVTTGITVLEAIERINRELGTLTVIITHNAVMAEMADRVLYLSDGKIVRVRRNPLRLPASGLEW
jgi:putative ABC transport system ATP-binding protein